MRVQKIEDQMVYYGHKNSGLLFWKIKNAVVLVVLIFLKHNGLCGQAISSSQLWQVDSTVDNFHNLWPLQEVVHDKIILRAYFDYSKENIFVQSI